MATILHIVPPTENVLYTGNNITLKIGDKIVGSGKLYITTDALLWQPENMRDGISIVWKQVGVHGIGQTPAQTRCIYFMLDFPLIWRGVYEGEAAQAVVANGNGGAAGDGPAAAVVPMDGANNRADDEEDEGNVTDDNDDDEGNPEQQMTECWLIPENGNAVDAIFIAMNDCQSLHPDSADSVSAESDFMDDDGDEDGLEIRLGEPIDDPVDPAAAAQGAMRNLNIEDSRRFEDADEDE